MALADIRYSRLGYVALNVSDLARSSAFYRTIVGLEPVPSPADCALFRCSERHHDLALYEGEPGVKRIGWQMESDAAREAVREELGGLGIAVSDVAPEDLQGLGIEGAIRAIEPTTGTVFEFYTSMPQADSPYEPNHTKIARLGHLVLTSPDRPATEQFLLEHLNFRVSDRIEGVVTFMRCFPNPLHHSFGVGKAHGETAGFQHINFMVTDIDDIGRAVNRLNLHEVPIVFGPGRHPTSDSIFLYFLDPDGLTVEYSFGMEEFPEVGDRAPREFPLEHESVDSWGGRAKREFGRVGSVETAGADK